MPSRTRKAPPAQRPLSKREIRRQDATGHGIRVTLDGREYTVHVGDLSAHDTSALRRETGMSFRGLLEAAAKDPDIDVLAAIVWLARRIDGEPALDYATVAEEISYLSELDVDAVEPTAEASSPVVIEGQVADSPEG